MKKSALIIALSLFFSSIAYSEMQTDGFDVTPLFAAAKTFTLSDAKIATFTEYIKTHLEQNSSGSWTDNDKQYEEIVYLDKKGNSVKIYTEKSISKNAGTVTITLTGPEDFVTPLRNMLK